MKNLQVSVTEKPQSYPLYMGRGLFPLLAQHLSEKPLASRYAVITDSTVDALWAPQLLAALAERGLTAQKFVMPAGETYKTGETKQTLENQMLGAGLGRDTAVLALGGGVVGDVAGFVAATYMRGVPVIQIPTTTLAMADSSVGGKTGVDTPYGKNLIGAFHQPVAVYMDMDTLQTLDEKNYRAGLAEVAKHGLIQDITIVSRIEENLDLILRREPQVLEELLALSCQVKSRVVAEDDQERGLRQILNYGHTMGHAVEMLSHFDMIHGECVAVGMVYAAKLALRLGLCDRAWADRQRNVLEMLGLPVRIPEFMAPQEVIHLMKMDKKARDGQIRFVLSLEPGRVQYGVPVADEEIISCMKER